MVVGVVLYGRDFVTIQTLIKYSGRCELLSVIGRLYPVQYVGMQMLEYKSTVSFDIRSLE